MNKQQQRTTSIAIRRISTQHQDCMVVKIVSQKLTTLPVIVIILFIAFIPASHSFSLPPASRSLQPPYHYPSTPEEAVQNQLYYYQTDQLSHAYQCCSPSNQKATGSLSEFKRLVNEPPYDLILNHERADVLLELKPGDIFPTEESGVLDMVCCLVCVFPNRMARRRYPVWFWWEMSQMELSESDYSPNNESSATWMVDCIMPDFEDLDFETQSLSIEDFGAEDSEGDDDFTIFWDFDA